SAAFAAAGWLVRFAALARLPFCQAVRNADVTCLASCCGVEPVGIMPVTGTAGGRLMTKTTVSAMAAITARLPASDAMRILRRLPRLPRLTERPDPAPGPPGPCGCCWS